MRALVLLGLGLLAAIAAATAGGGQKADGITISVWPLINPQMVSGSVASGRGGQKVTVQFKQCGLLPIQFRDVSEVTTLDGGSWSDELGASTNGDFRAVSGDAVSASVTVQERADVRLAPRPPGRYEVEVVSTLSFWRKHVLLQRFDRRKRIWITVRPPCLSTSSALVSSGQRPTSSRPSSQSERRSARFSRSTKRSRASSPVTAPSASHERVGGIKKLGVNASRRP